MLKITDYQRNAKQNYNEISPHPTQNGHKKKNPQITSAGEGREKGTTTLLVGT